jgi:hypothetical protein
MNAIPCGAQWLELECSAHDARIKIVQPGFLEIVRAQHILMTFGFDHRLQLLFFKKHNNRQNINLTVLHHHNAISN